MMIMTMMITLTTKYDDDYDDDNNDDNGDYNNDDDDDDDDEGKISFMSWTQERHPISRPHWRAISVLQWRIRGRVSMETALNVS